MSDELHKKLAQFVEDRHFAEFGEKIKIESDTELFASGYVDSLGFVALMMILAEQTGINIDEFMLIDRQELNTINNIISRVQVSKTTKTENAEDNHSVAFLVSGFIPKNDQSYDGFANFYQSEKIIKTKFDECADIIQQEFGINISETVLANLAEKRIIARSLILFSIEYALLHFWQSIGVNPKALLGDGIGEYVIACFSGVIDLTDVIALLTSNMQESSGQAEQELKSEPINHIQQNSISNIKFFEPQIPFISSCDGDWIKDEALNPTYWNELINNSAFFSSGLMKLLEDQNRIFIEIGLTGDISKKFNMNGATSGKAILPAFVNIPDKDKMHEALCEAIGFLHSKEIEITYDLNK